MFPKLRSPLARALSALHRRASLLLILAWLLIAAGAALVLLRAQDEAREQIHERFAARTDTTAEFVKAYVRELAAQERRVARSTLGGRTVSAAAFERAVELLGSSAAVLLDHRGRALHVLPDSPALTGTDLASRYDHLRRAVDGETGVSSTVGSAANGTPIVAFAVPYDTPFGRRVISAGFPVQSLPVASHLRDAAVTAPNRAFLIDATGTVVGGSVPRDGQVHGLASVVPAVASALERATSGRTSDGDRYIAQSIAGTPWRLVMIAPESTMYAAVRGSRLWVPWALWLGFVAAGLGSVVLVRRLIANRRELREINAQLDQLARVDALTGLPNRRSLEEQLRATLASAARHGYDASVLMIDVDHFKSINDSCGHAGGDEVLIALARCLREVLRDADVVGRWGGEEFLAVLPFTDAAGAEAVAERARAVVRRTPMTADGQPVLVTISIGAAAARSTEAPSALLYRTDAALYQAKARGRDRVVVADARRDDTAAGLGFGDEGPRILRPADSGAPRSS